MKYQRFGPLTQGCRMMDTRGRLTQTSATSIYLKQQLEDTLIEHRQPIDKYGEDPADMRYRSPLSAGNLA